MSNLWKKSALLAVVAGGMMFQFGACLGGQWRWIWAILEEDIFG